MYLTSGGAITEAGTAKILAGALGMTAAGAITVNTATNDVTTLSALTTSGNVQYQDATGVAIANIGSTGNYVTNASGTGITTAGGSVDVKNVTGLLAITNDINAGAGNVYLTSGGAITEAGTAKILANALGMNAAGAISVNSATNNVTTVSATSTGTTAATSAITYRDADAVTVGTVAAAGNFTGSTGINSAAGNGVVTVQNGAGTLTVASPISAGSGNVFITSGANIVETGVGGFVGTTGTLTTSTVTGQTLNGANTVSGFNASNTTSGNIALANTAAPLTITGISQTASPVSAANGNVGIVNTGAIGNSAAAVMNVAGNTSLTTLGGALNGINIGNAAGDTFNTGTLTFNSAGAVNITEDSNMLVTGLNSAGTLILQTPLNDIDSTLGTAITVTGTTVQLLAGGTIGGLEAGEVAKTTVGGVGYNSFGTITANSSNIVVQAGGVTNGVSVDIVGSSINGLLTLTPPKVPVGAVLFNGLAQTSAPFVKTQGLGPVAGFDAALVEASRIVLTGNGNLLPSGFPTTTDAFLSSVFPTESVRKQITAGNGIVGMLAPMVALQGIGVNVSGDIERAFQRQLEEEKRRLAQIAAAALKP